MLFLGAGASLASGLPTTAQMTTALLDGEGFIRQTWNRYELGEGYGPDPDAEVRAIVGFLPTIQALTRLASDATYEDRSGTQDLLQHSSRYGMVRLG